MEARTEYLENRVKQLMAEIGGYKETLQSNECLMAAMVKKAGGEMTVRLEDVKAATEQKLRLVYRWDPEAKEFHLKTEG